jgi:hypothetical protein
MALPQNDIGDELQNQARISALVSSFQEQSVNSPPTSNVGMNHYSLDVYTTLQQPCCNTRAGVNSS